MGARMTIFFGEEPGIKTEAAQHSTETFPETLDEVPGQWLVFLGHHRH